MDHAEAHLRAAVDTGDTEQILRLCTLVDQLQAEQRDRRGVAGIGSVALWYAQQGLGVFPLQPRSKIPYKGSRGCKDATCDPDTIRAWWQAAPESNLAVATGHLVDVVDVDGTPGHISRARHRGLFDTLTVIGVVNTPRPGGVHLYVPAREGVGNKAGMLPGVDYRGAGGYVVAPPSLTDVGDYQWNTPLDLAGVLEVAA